ncbi:hypothetical protein BC941DRAFT_429062 [Chlamydoabsidia padenii]|nr:hypothetical protein BC941DRAFT_429062 [Chlamydoabsidia padenii]
MITARYEPHVFPTDRTSLGRCTPPPSSNSSDGGDDIDRFMELAHAALEEATKEEDAKGVLQELVERVLARTGAPLMAGIITEQLRSQEVIEQLAEKSFERQARRRQQLFTSTRPLKQRRNNVLTTSLSSSSALSTRRPSSSPLQRTKPSSSSPSVISSTSALCSLAPSISAPSSSSTTTIGTIQSISLKDPHDPLDEEAVTRDQFIIQQTTPLHTQPDRLLLVSEYIWRLFRLLILACLVALVYHYVYSYPQQWFV